MSHHRLLWILFFLTCYDLVSAQHNDSIRNEYIHSYSDYFFLGPLIERDNLDFDVIAADDNRKRYSYKSNVAYSLGVNVNLFDVNLRVSFSTPLAAQSRFIYGKSEVTDLQIIAITKKWFADAFYQKYNGFYVESPDEIIPAGQPFPQRADIDTKNYGMSFAYVFKHDQFSIRAPYIFSEHQKKSKGSFLLSFVLSTFSMKADSALVPSSQWAQWGEGSQAKEMRFTSLGLGPGYSHTFVLNKLFLNLTLVLGPAHYWVRYENVADRTHDDIRIDLYSLGRIGIGYNGDRFFGGMSVTTQSRNITYENVTMQYGTGTFRLVLGYRFKEQGFLKRKAVDLIPTNP